MFQEIKRNNNKFNEISQVRFGEGDVYEVLLLPCETGDVVFDIAVTVKVHDYDSPSSMFN